MTPSFALPNSPHRPYLPPWDMGSGIRGGGGMSGQVRGTQTHPQPNTWVGRSEGQLFGLFFFSPHLPKSKRFPGETQPPGDLQFSPRPHQGKYGDFQPLSTHTLASARQQINGVLSD